MTWILHVLLVVSINGQPAYLHAIVKGPVAFDSLEACAAHGRRYVSDETKVLCDAPTLERQVEVAP